MRRLHTFLIIFSALCMLPFISCSSDGLFDSFETGGNFTQSNIRIVEIDTFNVKMSTFRYDSITSAADSRLLVGRYTDPIFGAVKSTGYAHFVPSSYYINNEAIFDSIVLNLEYDGYYYNDTLATKTINVQQLSNEFRFRTAQSTDFYNSSSIPVFDEVIGTKTFTPYISKDSVTVPLNYGFGQNLFTKIQRGIVYDTEQLNDYFKGLKIAPAATEDASIIGFNVSKCYLRFYYSLPGDQDYSDNYYDFAYYNTTDKKYFNHVESDRSGTILQSLTGQKNELYSAAGNGFTYVQSGVGITTKITFPTIRDIYMVNENEGDVFTAKLKMKLNAAYFNRQRYLPDSLAVYIVDQNNDLVDALYDDAGNAVMGHIDKADTENNEVYLNATVTSFIQKSLTDNDYLKYGLVFIPVGFNSRADRIVINGETNSNYRSRLQLTYTIYDE